MGKGTIPETIAATGLIYTGSGWLRKAIITVNTTATSAEGRIYDSTTESGTTILRYFIPLTAVSAIAYKASYNIDFSGAGVKFGTGLYGVCSAGVSMLQTFRDE